MLIIDEIFLIGNRMLTFIDCKLCDIKQTHNKFVGDFNVTMMYRWFLSNFIDSKFMDFQIKN
jgi:hypothetical protein